MIDLRRTRASAGLCLLLLSALAAASVAACKRGRSAPPAPDASAASSSSSPLAAAALDGGGLPPSIPNAAASVAKVRPALRACFADQLRRSSTPIGTVTFTIEVGGDGHVTSATPKTHEGLDDACLACMTEGVKTGAFERPLDGLPATVVAPFTFNAIRDRRAPGALPSVFLPPNTSSR